MPAVDLLHRLPRGFWWCDRRETCQSPARPPPFSSACGAMSFGGGAVDCLEFTSIHGDKGRQNAVPDPPARPSMKAVVNRRWGSVLRRTILPSAARLEHMDDAANHTTVVNATRTSSIPRQLEQTTLKRMVSILVSGPNLQTKSRRSLCDSLSQLAYSKKSASRSSTTSRSVRSFGFRLSSNFGFGGSTK